MTTQSLESPAQIYQRLLVPMLFEPCATLLLREAAPKRGDAVLDLACGTGVVARRAAAVVGRDGSVVAVDAKPGMLAVARSLDAPDGAVIDWRLGDATQLDLLDGAYDLVLCQHGLQFFGDRAGAMKHVRRVLAPAGRAAFAVWRGLDLNGFARGMAEAEARHLGSVGISFEELVAPFALGSGAALRGLIEGAGFVDVEIVELTMEARVASPDTIVRDVELAYAAIVPEFIEDPEAFEAFVERVTADTRELVRAHTRDGSVVIPMHLHVASGRVPA